MGNSRHWLRDGLIVAAMVGLSFLAGWSAHKYDFANSRRINFDFSKPFIVPSGYEPIGTTPTPETASFIAGDRIDIFVDDGDTIEPLILDAIVTHQTKTNFGMLLPYGGHDLLGHARDNGLQLIYRYSVAPDDPVALKQYRG